MKKRRPRPPVEARCEQRCIKLAEQMGSMHYKLNGLGRRGKDDHVFVTYNGYVWWVEFKREDEEPRKLQEIEHGRLLRRGQMHSVIKTFAEFKFKLEWIYRLKEHKRPRGW